MVHVKLIDSFRIQSLEQQVNEFLKTVTEDSLIDVKITSVREGRGQNEGGYFVCLILLRD